ncbi:MAG TPA: cupin domain-containing protein [Chitinophagaceae bacterium]|jgi:mannose-6-phosphate isomerase-like protein (cupin superfamily)
MDYKEYISTGIIENYCLGTLSDEESKIVEQNALFYPEIQQEIEQYMQVLEQYSLDLAFNHYTKAKKKIFQCLNNLKLEYETNINKLPLLNKYSDYKNWLQIVKPLLPEKLTDAGFRRELKNESGVSQTLIWSAVDCPYEVHYDEDECFIILKGRCRCHIGDTVVEVATGGFLEIPVLKPHDMKILEPVLAVVQRIKIA